jgi:transposase InsO family protein
VNHKRVYRVMRQAKLLLQRSIGRPHRVHDGVIVSFKSNLRWCSDTFEIWCWSGERVVAAAGIEQSDRVPEARR